MSGWTEQDIPDQTGRTVLITGANSGLGLRSAQVLAEKGARVLMACRSPERGEAALETVLETGGKAELIQLDLADLGSVRAAAAEVRELTSDHLDLLMNNAGVMTTPEGRTKDGFELQFGTNHLGHAALTWLLAPALRGGDASRVVTPRVVTLSSLVHRVPGFDVTDLNFERRRYSAVAAYSQAKTANLMFAIELDRRADGQFLSVAAHPGVSNTELLVNSAAQRGSGGITGTLKSLSRGINKLFTQPVSKGSLPQLYAATAPDVRGGEFFGPAFEMYGRPGRARPRRGAQDPELAAELWQRTAEMTGVTPDPA